MLQSVDQSPIAVQPSTLDGWRPNHVQSELLARQEEEMLFGGARGGGKTDANLAWLADEPYMTHHDYRSLVIRRDYNDLSDFIFRAKRFYGSRCEVVGVPAEIRWSWGGVTRLGHWKDRDTIHKYLGHEYWKIACEEITQSISSLEEYYMILGSMRCAEPNLPAQFLATTNPGGPGHTWCKKYFVEMANCEPYEDPKTGYSRIFIPARATDNPFLPKTYVSWLDGLPDTLRSAWRDGSWDTYEGQFFSEFGGHLRCEPFTLSENQVVDNLFGSLDVGTTHPTSFGLWWRSPERVFYRIKSYLNASSNATHADHAQAIFDMIQACEYTHGIFPNTIWADPAAWTKVQLNQAMVRSPIDEYIDLFKDRKKHTIFEKGNNDKHSGCQTMRNVMRGRDGLPGLRYFDKHNRTFEDGMMSIITDKNDQEIYAKQPNDDTADECRYGIVGLNSVTAAQVHGKEIRASLDKYNKRRNNIDWKDV
jgi:hypothetical protein